MAKDDSKNWRLKQYWMIHFMIKQWWNYTQLSCEQRKLWWYIVGPTKFWMPISISNTMIHARWILFLIYKVDRTLFISFDHIINLFRSDGCKHPSCDRIDERESYIWHCFLFSSPTSYSLVQRRLAINSMKMKKHDLQTIHPLILSTLSI